MRERVRRPTADRRHQRWRWRLLGGALALVVTSTVVGRPADAAFSFLRWAGASRWATSAAVSLHSFPSGATTVIVASGTSFPDALAAGPLAGSLGAPVLLTDPAALPAPVEAELRRLAPAQVLIVGGTGAVSDAVAAQIRDITSADPLRLGGANRYETAAGVAAHGFAAATTVYVASGISFPDALTGGAAGGQFDRPVLLTDPHMLSLPTRDAIAALGHPSVTVLGGPTAVSDAVLGELDALTDGVVQRVSGPNRFATSVAVSVASFATAETVFLASGLGFPDALSAAAAAGAAGAPILLTQPGCVPAQALTEIYRLGATNVITIGGPGAVGPEAAGLVPCGPPVTPLYSFMAPAPGTWARWNSCRQQIRYHVYTQGAAAGELDAIPAAVAAAEAASGFDFVFVGYVDDDNVWPADSDAYIGFTTALDGSAIGEGGIYTLGDEIVNGYVEVETGLSPEARHHTLIHELGHMLGIDHADDADQVMFWQLQTPLTQYAAGDLEGLRLVGTTMPCISSAALSREAPQLTTWVDTREEG